MLHKLLTKLATRTVALCATGGGIIVCLIVGLIAITSAAPDTNPGAALVIPVAISIGLAVLAVAIHTGRPNASSLESAPIG